jgi:hypothetical protein
MNTQIRIAAVAGVLLALTGFASAQEAIVIPPSYNWTEHETFTVPGDVRASTSAPIRHREPHVPRPYGQW